MTGNELKEAREAAGLTQKELGQAVKISAAAVQKMEYHREREVPINQKYWPVFADLLHKPVGDFAMRVERGIRGTSKIVTSTASDGSTAVAAGRDASVYTTPDTVKLSPKLCQVAELSQLYDPGERVLDKALKTLLELKKVHDAL